MLIFDLLVAMLFGNNIWKQIQLRLKIILYIIHYLKANLISISLKTFSFNICINEKYILDFIRSSTISAIANYMKSNIDYLEVIFHAVNTYLTYGRY